MGLIETLTASGDPTAALEAAGLTPNRWSASAGYAFARHAHPLTKRLFVLRGEISVNDDLVTAGEGIRIPAGTEHEAFAGPDGVECVEAFEGL